MKSNFRIGLVAIFSFGALSIDAWALGGNDQDLANQIGKDSARCQATISKEVIRFSGQVVKGISRCFDGVLRCDQSSTAADADDCIGELLIENRGRCAIGALSTASPYVGVGSGAGALDGEGIDSSVIGRAAVRFVEKIGRKCISPDVDLTVSGTGLGVGAGPFTEATLSDALNGSVDRGVGCSAHRLLRDAYPLTDEIVDRIKAHPAGGNAAFVINLLNDDAGPYMDCQ